MRLALVLSLVAGMAWGQTPAPPAPTLAPLAVPTVERAGVILDITVLAASDMPVGLYAYRATSPSGPWVRAAGEMGIAAWRCASPTDGSGPCQAIASGETWFCDMQSVLVPTLYYQVTSVDAAGVESSPSNIEGIAGAWPAPPQGVTAAVL